MTLIYYAIKAAKDSNLQIRLLVSTDDEEIAMGGAKI